ncbi:unnamed protein product [Polarella glacialis]|uniref:Uncharacterized protein n=1 Tax=Polarella glacialis TaxID=89957 RepID=A0A813I1C8_POLGL|nr:unnamed protein product [Polarella glacialis]
MFGGLFIGPSKTQGPEKGKKDSKGKGKSGSSARTSPTMALEPQAVLIGDHKQLQPTLQSQVLELNKAFGISLFERLASNGLACGYAAAPTPNAFSAGTVV